MKVTIVYFSQTKNTHQITQAIANGLSNKEAEVELVDWMKIKDKSFEDIIAHCDLLGIGTRIQFQGRSFRPLLRGEEIPTRFEYSQTANEEGRANSYAIRSNEWKLIVGPGGKEELYSLADAEERKSVAGQNSDVVASLKSKLNNWIGKERQTSLEKSRVMDEGMIEKLEALGYIRK
jgi:hypothetical protein